MIGRRVQLRRVIVIARRHQRLITVFAALVAVFAVALGVVSWHRSRSDCNAVRALVSDSYDFETVFAEDVNGRGADRQADLERMSRELGATAAGIRDAGLARRARDVGELADQMARLAPRPAKSASERELVAWQNDVVGVLRMFGENLSALREACPDSTERIRIGDT